MNEGYLGKFTFEGERAATDDHPVILHALPLASTVTEAMPAGALLKLVVEDTMTRYAPLTAEDSAEPCAVADKPCDPTGAHGEKSVIAVVHGTVKTRLLTAGGSAATEAQLVKLMEHGIFAV